MREGQILVDSNAAVQGTAQVSAMGYTNTAEIKKSPINAALDLLEARVEGAHVELSKLRTRLSPVSIPNGIDTKTDPAQKGRPLASCAVEQRIADITDAISSIAADIQSTRNCLCI